MMEPAVYTPQPLAPADPAPAPVVLPDGPLTVAYLPGPDGRMVAAYVPAHALAAAPQPASASAIADVDPAPRVVRTGLDPVAQRLAGAGVAAAGVGWGVGEVVSALAGATSSVALIAAAVVAVKVLPAARRTTVVNRTEHHHHTTATGLFGRATSRVDHRQSGGR
ncbi:hypothetical protein [Streptomyces sp. NPDC001380]|uniref:hypothetical protein n=1 Tax=Streptomyces sp. NPDC001380 TaxID=3364566 RepID=UPI0036BCC1E5